MKRLIITSLVLLAVALSVKSQNLIARQNGGAPTFYTKLPDAVAAAAAGDTLYIPGGSWDPIIINKPLHLIGAGHNPDSTTVTNRTLINAITFDAGAGNGSMTGVYVSSVSTNSSFSNYIFSRCYIASLQLDSYPGFVNISFYENILGYTALAGDHHSFYNNVFFGTNVGTDQTYLNSSIIKNNIFLNYGLNYGSAYPYAPLHASNCIIENNFFPQILVNYSSQIILAAVGANNVYRNNVNAGVNGTDGSSQGSGNLITTLPVGSLSVIFPNLGTGSGDGIYKADFQLQPGSQFKNGGTDGTDLGIYGGSFPWKNGSIPFNPHFQTFKVAPQTDASGNLKVQITVAAQNN